VPDRSRAVAGHSIGTAVIALRSRPNTRVTAVKVTSPETESQAGPRATDGDLQSPFDPAPLPHGRVSREVIKSTIGTDSRVAGGGATTPKHLGAETAHKSMVTSIQTRIEPRSYFPDASVDPTDARNGSACGES
jgi:hypothetical protein